MKTPFNKKRLTVGIYDYALHFVGGGQMYGVEIAAALQERYAITLISSKSVTSEKLTNWYGLDTSLCDFKVLELPSYMYVDEDRINPGIADLHDENPFDLISEESRNYDIFVVNQLEKIKPLSAFSVLLCHFPERPQHVKFFHSNKFSHIIANSKYTAGWIQKRWQLFEDEVIYPPVDAEFTQVSKEKIILSVARFDQSGSKQQHRMIDAFSELNEKYRKTMAGWKLILAGSSIAGNKYLNSLSASTKRTDSLIEVKANLTRSQILKLYARASIFWHICGLDEFEPGLVEHFGITTVESMQNKCVPIVVDGGGQREIVRDREDGYLVGTLNLLERRTVDVISNNKRYEQLSEGSYEQALSFGRNKFLNKIYRLFDFIDIKHSEFQKSDTFLDESLVCRKIPTRFIHWDMRIFGWFLTLALFKYGWPRRLISAYITSELGILMRILWCRRQCHLITAARFIRGFFASCMKDGLRASILKGLRWVKFS